MTTKEKNIALLLAGGLLLLPVITGGGNYRSVLSKFIPSVEGFSASPVWDYNQWSWGYGTPAGNDPYNRNVKPTGTITRAKAFDEMMKVIDENYSYLKPMLSRKLNGNQLASFLSFAYNTGPGNADNLIPNINSGNDTALFTQMRKYILAGGVRNDGLVNRREKEIKLWKS